MSSVTWLRELGAVRPMAPAGSEVLVLGEWHNGYYPIEWRLVHDYFTRDLEGHRVNFEPEEEWTVFGVKLGPVKLTREDCVRILERCK